MEKGLDEHFAIEMSLDMEEAREVILSVISMWEGMSEKNRKLMLNIIGDLQSAREAKLQAIKIAKENDQCFEDEKTAHARTRRELSEARGTISTMEAHRSTAVLRLLEDVKKVIEYDQTLAMTKENLKVAIDSYNRAAASNWKESDGPVQSVG